MAAQLAPRQLPEACRPEVKDLLKEIYGYDEFRSLEVYDDLSKGKDKIQLSQGQLIEAASARRKRDWSPETKCIT